MPGTWRNVARFSRVTKLVTVASLAAGNSSASAGTNFSRRSATGVFAYSSAADSEIARYWPSSPARACPRCASGRRPTAPGVDSRRERDVHHLPVVDDVHVHDRGGAEAGPAVDGLRGQRAGRDQLRGLLVRHREHHGVGEQLRRRRRRVVGLGVGARQPDLEPAFGRRLDRRRPSPAAGPSRRACRARARPRCRATRRAGAWARRCRPRPRRRAGPSSPRRRRGRGWRRHRGRSARRRRTGPRARAACARPVRALRASRQAELVRLGVRLVERRKARAARASRSVLGIQERIAQQGRQHVQRRGDAAPLQTALFPGATTVTSKRGWSGACAAMPRRSSRPR